MAIAIIKEASGFIIHINNKTKVQNQAISGLELEEGDVLKISMKAKCKLEYNTGKVVEFANQSVTYEVREADAGESANIENQSEPVKAQEVELTPIATGVVADKQEIRMDSTVSDNTQVDEYFEEIKQSMENKGQRLIPLPRVFGFKEGIRDGSLEIAILPDSETVEGDLANIQYENLDGKTVTVIYKKIAPNLWEKEPYPIVAGFPNRSDEGYIVIKPGSILHNSEVVVNIVTADGNFGESSYGLVFNEEYEGEPKIQNHNEQERSYDRDEEDDDDEESQEDESNDEDDSDDDHTAEDEEANEEESSNEDDEEQLSEDRYRDERISRRDEDFQIRLMDEENNEGDRYTIIYLLDGTEKMVSYVKNSRGRWSLEKEDAEGVFSDSKEVTSVITYYHEGVKIKELIYEPFRNSEIELVDFDRDGEIDYKEIDENYSLEGILNKNTKLIDSIEGKLRVGDHEYIPLRFIAPRNDEIFYSFECDIPKEHLLDNDLIKIEISYGKPGDIDINSAEEEIEYYLINKDAREESSSDENVVNEPTKEEPASIAKESEEATKEEDNTNSSGSYADLDPILVNKPISLENAPENGLIFLFVDTEGAMPRIYSIENNTIRKGEDDIGIVDDGVANLIVSDILVRANSEINIQAKFFKA